MKKKNFILVGLSIILQAIAITIPFIGIGKEGIYMSIMPISTIVSLFILMIALKNLYKETKIQSYHQGIIFSGVGICLLIIATLLSPLLASDEYISPYKYVTLLIEQEFNEIFLMIYTIQFFSSIVMLFNIVLLGMFIYAIAINKFANGSMDLNIEPTHKINLKKSINKFSIINFLIMLLSFVMIYIMKEFLEILLRFGSATLPDKIAATVIIYWALMFFIVLPGLMVLSVFYYINFIKSIIYTFKTSSKFLQEEKIELNKEV